MFEKEAEKWVKDNTEIIDDEELGMECIKEPQAKEAYLAGAEFGYNKANEEFKICEQNADTYYDKLQKAKEIIKNLMAFAEMDDREYEEEYKEAEQFLNSEVEQ